jgi:hypothetical protein
MSTSSQVRSRAWWYLALGLILTLIGVAFWPFLVGIIIILRAIMLFSHADTLAMREHEEAQRQAAARPAMTGRIDVRRVADFNLKTEADVLGSADDDVDLSGPEDEPARTRADRGDPDTNSVPVPNARPLLRH